MGKLKMVALVILLILVVGVGVGLSFVPAMLSILSAKIMLRWVRILTAQLRLRLILLSCPS
jgi:hypothetical protein